MTNRAEAMTDAEFVEFATARGFPVRPGMLVEQSCYGCLGTGYHVGFGSAPETPCYHHGPDCEPESRCVAPCEWADDEPGRCDDCGALIPAHNNPQTCTACRVAAGKAARRATA
jgi:hypothetical protein